MTTLRNHVCLRDWRYGKIIYRDNDRYVGRSVDMYGEFSEEEVDIFRAVVKPGHIAVDVGANIGAHTLALASLAKVVLAFEPLRHNFQMLCGNVAINDLRHVHCHQIVLSNEDGMMPIPLLDLDAPQNNYGSTQLDAPMREGSGYEPCQMAKLDSLLLRADFLKIDVEGMEEKVIRGAEKLIQRCRPVLYVEDDHEANHISLVQTLLDLDYVPIWHTPLLFNPENYANQIGDCFEGLASFNLLCLPKERRAEYNISGEELNRAHDDDFPMKARQT